MQERETNCSKLVVLTAHGLGNPPDWMLPVNHEMWLEAARLKEVLSLPAPQVLLTFDDGFASCWDIAVPALIDRGLRAKFFVTTMHIGQPGYLSGENLRSMVSHGMEIGSHGKCHRPWRGLDSKALEEEIFEAKDRLEQMLGASVTEAACPFGAYDRRSLSALRKAGMMRVYTSDRLPVRPDDWLVPRYTLRASDTLEDWRRIVGGHEPPLVWPQRLKVAVKRWR